MSFVWTWAWVWTLAPSTIKLKCQVQAQTQRFEIEIWNCIFPASIFLQQTATANCLSGFKFDEYHNFELSFVLSPSSFRLLSKRFINHQPTTIFPYLQHSTLNFQLWTQKTQSTNNKCQTTFTSNHIPSLPISAQSKSTSVPCLSGLQDCPVLGNRPLLIIWTSN